MSDQTTNTNKTISLVPLHIPHTQILDFTDQINELPEPRILYCRSGSRSAMALQMLQQTGVSGLFNAGGINDMRELLQDAGVAGH